MADRQDSKDDILSISRKFEGITTTDQNLNSQNNSFNNQSPSNVNASKMNQQEVKRLTKSNEYPSVVMAPGENIKERILFVVDTAREVDWTPYEIGSGAKYPPFTMIKRVIEIFLNIKSTINKKHEYGLMKLTDDSSEWICDFTNNYKSLINHLEKLEEIDIDENHLEYDLTPCFDMIYEKVDFELNVVPPKQLTRVILIYSRSHCFPKFTDPQTFDLLMEHPNFFVDVLYVHERLNDVNECEDIYLKLAELDAKQNSYIFEVGRNAATLHNTMAKLLAHPLQRPKQDDASYTLRISEASAEVQTNV